MNPYPLNLGGDISPLNFGGAPQKNAVKQGISDTPPPKCWVGKRFNRSLVRTGRVLESPSNPPNCRKKEQILEKGTFIFCAKPWYTKPWFKRDLIGGGSFTPKISGVECPKSLVLQCFSEGRPQNLGGDISPLNFGGAPQKNAVKQGISDTPPPKFWEWNCHPPKISGVWAYRGCHKWVNTTQTIDASQGSLHGGASLKGERQGIARKAVRAIDPRYVAARMPKGPFRTKNTTALNSVVFYYCRSFLLSVAICCWISL